MVQADLAFGALEALLDGPADPGHPDQPDQGGGGRGETGVEGQLTSERLRRTSSHRVESAVAGAASSTRVQSYSRRPVAPWPALQATHWVAGTAAASWVAVARTDPAVAATSGSVHLTAST